MKLSYFKEQFKDKTFDIELSTGKILKKVTFNFSGEESNGFIVINQDDTTHIIGINHIVRITPHIGGEMPLFSFT